MSSTIKLFDKDSMSLLFEYDIHDIELAYKKAEEYESFGVDILLRAPSLPETLIRTLGGNDQSVLELNEMLDEEIRSHIEEDGGCSICPPKK